MSNEIEIICYCKNISRVEVETAIQNGAKSLTDIQEITGACNGHQCKELNPNGVSCAFEIIAMLPKEPNKCTCCCE